MSFEDFAKWFPVVPAALALPVAVLSWITAQRSQHHQATKAELDALLAASKETNDEPYRRFLLDLHKERVVSLAIGREVPLAEVGKVIAIYQQAEHSPSDLRAIWPYRDRHSAELRCKLDWWDTAQLCCAVFVLVACLIEMVLCLLVVVLARDWSERSGYLVLEGVFGGGFVLLARLHRGLFRAHRLDPATKRWPSKREAKSTESSGTSDKPAF